MFRFFPKGQQDWLRVLVFPFQAFVILAPIEYWYFMRLYGYFANNVFGPRLYYFDCINAAKHLGAQIAIGYAICFFALVIFGFYQKAMKHPASAFGCFFLAALSVIDLIIMPNC